MSNENDIHDDTDIDNKYRIEQRKNPSNEAIHILSSSSSSSSPIHLETNLHFIWDSILETIASYTKDKSILSLHNHMRTIMIDENLQIHNSNDCTDKEKQQDGNGHLHNTATKTSEPAGLFLSSFLCKFRSLLPPTLHISLSILSHCPEHGWNALLNHMAKLTVELTKDYQQQLKKKEINDNNGDDGDIDGEEKNHTSHAVDIKRNKVQLLGICLLIKIYCCFHLSCIQKEIEISMVGTTSMKATKSSHDGVNDDDHYGGSKCTDDFKTLLSAMSMIVKEVPSLIIQIIKSTEEKRTLLGANGAD